MSKVLAKRDVGFGEGWEWVVCIIIFLKGQGRSVSLWDGGLCESSGKLGIVEIEMYLGGEMVEKRGLEFRCQSHHQL